MTDAQFLTWVRDRLVHVYGESPNVDFIQRLTDLATAVETHAPLCSCPCHDADSAAYERDSEGRAYFGCRRCTRES